jgi:hypothetical protein
LVVVVFAAAVDVEAEDCSRVALLLLLAIDGSEVMKARSVGLVSRGKLVSSLLVPDKWPGLFVDDDEIDDDDDDHIGFSHCQEQANANKP